MALKYTNTKVNLKIEWESEDKSQTASFSIPKLGTDAQQVKALIKALAFLGAQTGVVPPPSTAPTGATAMTTPLATSARTVESAAAPPGPNTAPRLQMTPPAGLSDAPAGGPPPVDRTFWESMPTTTLPPQLASSPMGWEMIPPGEVE